MKRFKLIACKVLYREIGLITSTCENFIDVTYLRQGYHDAPDVLRRILQREIDLIDGSEDPHSCDVRKSDPFDAILLGYGLCSNGIAGIKSKKYKIVAPRAHDCITLFLGSKERYRTLFDQMEGAYWYTSGWIENTRTPSKESYDYYYKQYCEEYGEENTEYLMEAQFDWHNKYKSLGYIDMPGLNFPHYEKYSREAAAHLGWQFNKIQGDMSLLNDFLAGRWDDERFLVAEPGERIAPSFDQNIIKTEPPMKKSQK